MCWYIIDFIYVTIRYFIGCNESDRDNVSNKIFIWSKLKISQICPYGWSQLIISRHSTRPFSKSFRCMWYLLRDSFVLKCLCLFMRHDPLDLIRLVTSLFNSIAIWICVKLPTHRHILCVRTICQRNIRFIATVTAVNHFFFSVPDQ